MEAVPQCVLLLLTVGVTLTSSTLIDGVCTVPTISNPAQSKPRPQIPNLFRVDVECAMQEQNRSIFVREYYDYGNNRGRITQMDNKRHGDVFYDYANNEIIIVDTSIHNFCLVGKLSTSDDGWTFGYKPDRKQAGHYHIFGASGALHFGDTPEQYVGRSVVRGIVTDRWDSCQYSAALNATMNVTWYFSAKPQWDMQLGAQVAPIRATAVGKQYKQGKIVPFNHTYDLYNYEMTVANEDFEIPVGVVCPHRVNTRQFPSFPNRFSFVGEIIDYGHGIVSYMEENYDGQADVNVFRYKREKDMSTTAYTDRIVQINDYNSGVSYVIDTVADSCMVEELGTDGVYFVRYLPNGKLMMKDPAQFFADTSNHLFTYAGVRTTRDIPCDLWVATTDQVQGFTDRNVTVEWYFAITNDKERWNAQDSKWRLPVQFRIWDKGEDDPVWELNVFFYDTVRPSLVNTDLRPCFRGVHRRCFTFDIDGSARNAVFNNIEMLKYQLVYAITVHARISQIRVADIRVYDDIGVMHVSFDLLDKPGFSGNTANLTSEYNLDQAVAAYHTAISDGTFTLPITHGETVQTIKPVFGSSAEVGSGQSGSFTTGALAGLGVAMIVVGSAGGAGAAFFFFK
ncbi:hypothetical protein ACOMHN_020668 [Nucella lapillus]